ncbi:MAG: ABC transporter substrate-binding protein/permease, partial [Butyricicoccaceae bacterium]
DLGIAGMTVTEDRLKNIDFSDPYTTSRQVVIVQDDSVATTKVENIDDLDTAKIGVQIGTTGDIYATDKEETGATIERYQKGADAVQALKTDKIDCVVIDEQPAKSFVASTPGLKILDEEFVTEEYAICAAKGNTELLDQVNAALATLKENGTMDQIVANYIGDDTKGTCPYESPADVKRDNGTLVVATNAEFEPYEYMQDGEIVGIDMEMAQAIADILGKELKIENIQFDSIITSVSSGKADLGIAGMTVTEDRLKNIDFSDPYTTSKQVVIVKDNSASGSTKLTFKEKLYQNFIEENRWQYITRGLLTTIEIAFFALIIGLLLGFLIAIARSACDMTGKAKLLNWILKAYLTVIRGTPSMIQLLIIYYVIFASTNIDKVLVACVAFGLNSSAYIAEIVRSGIMSIDNGQMEAGRSLGFNYTQTMYHIILPQAFKNVLPALGNEFIVLLKETSISGYIGIADLTRGGDFIRSRTYEALIPLLAVAIIYLILVMVLSAGVGALERRLRNNEQR